VVPVARLDAGGSPADADGGAGRPVGRRTLSVGAGETVDAAIWRRDDLPASGALAGPLVVEQPDATTVVPAGWTVRRDGHGNLELAREAAP
jgi:N-methylhydantoinase A